MKRQLLIIALALAALTPSVTLAYDRYASSPYTDAVCYDRWGNAYDCRYTDPYYRGSYSGLSVGVIGYGVWPYYGHHHHYVPHHDFSYGHHGYGHAGHGGYGHGIGHHGHGGHGGGHGGHGH